MIMSQWSVFLFRQIDISFEVLNVSNASMLKKKQIAIDREIIKNFISLCNTLWLMRFFKNPKCLIFTEPLP